MQATKSLAPEVLEKVPPFPPVAAKLLNTVSNPDAEMREVAQLIASDATYTARLLRCVNSYEFGLKTPVTNIQQAVAMAGLDRIRQIAATQAAATITGGTLRTDELRRCWQHSIATAVLADEIAHACGAFITAAFTAGIMHDIGRLGLVVAYPDRYERVIRNAAAQCVDLLDFEQEEFGVNHTEAGRYLAERWGLPEELRMVAGRHHDASDGSEMDLVRIVHIACRLADSLGYDVTRPLVPVHPTALLDELPPSARQRFYRTPEQLCALIDKKILEFDPDPGRAEKEPKIPSEPEQKAAEEAVRKDAARQNPGLAALAEAVSPQNGFPEPGSEPRRHSMVPTVVWTLAVIAAVAALLVWKLR